MSQPEHKPLRAKINGINEELIDLLATDKYRDNRPALRRLRRRLERSRPERIATEKEIDGIMKVVETVNDDKTKLEEKLKTTKKYVEKNRCYVLKTIFVGIVFTGLYHHGSLYASWEKAIKTNKGSDLQFWLNFVCNFLSGVMLMTLIFLWDFIPKNCARERELRRDGIVEEEKKTADPVVPSEMSLADLTQRQKEVINYMDDVLEPKKEEFARLSRQYYCHDMINHVFYVVYLAARMFISYRAVWQLCTIWDATNAAIFTSIMIDAWQGLRNAGFYFCVSTEMATVRPVRSQLSLVF